MTHPELGPPPPLPENGLRVVALGGLGEIGRNMTVFEYGGRLLIVDCGVLFPEDHQPGVDLILPDFEWIRDRLDQVEAVVLTHGHEDHIGAVPYLLREKADLPRHRVDASRWPSSRPSSASTASSRTRSRSRRARSSRSGPFGLEFVAVNHSIPDALAVAIRTPAGQLVLHTGDFKMDQLPLDGRITDLRAFARLGEEGVDLFLTDSTNAEVPGFVRTEREIEPTIDRVFSRAAKRIIVASFASHVHRIQQVLDIARRTRPARRVRRSLDGAQHGGRARPRLPEDPGRASSSTSTRSTTCPDNRVVLVSTGSQGEPMAALSRMASNDHQIRITEGDTVLLASSLIPGNENAVYRVINGLSKLGRERDPQGERARPRQRARRRRRADVLLQHREAAPRHAGPRRVAAPARQRRPRGRHRGPARERPAVRGRRWSSTSSTGVASITGAVPAATSTSTASSVGDVTESSLKDRRILGSEGFISVLVVVDLGSGKVVGRPGDPRPRLRRGRHRLRRHPAQARPAASRTRCARAPPTPTSSSRSSAGRSAPGSAASSAAAR